MSEIAVRPTKKQRELLSFIEAFIAEHGYSPSYREVMTGLDYNSVATVSLHINSLIRRGHLRKRDRSARSLEVTGLSGTASPQAAADSTANPVQPAEEKWLVQKVEHHFKALEEAEEIVESAVDQLYVLIGTLKILGLQAAATSFMPRLNELQARLTAAK